MYRLVKIIQRDTINLLTNPMWIFFSLMFPFLLVAILGFLTEGLYGDYFTSYDYYGVTLMLFSAMYAGTFSANSFMEEKIKRANLRIVYSPIRNWFIPFSKVLFVKKFIHVSCQNRWHFPYFQATTHVPP